MIIMVLILGWFGLIFGSFVNALVWRIHKKQDWVKARSQCPNCRHKLGATDLVPVLSWLALRGRCRYCRKPISPQYPVIEISGAMVFSLSYLFWPAGFNSGQIVLFIAWLAVSVGLLALAVYDLRWMLLPSKIIYPTLAAAAAGRLIYLLGFEQHKFHGLLWWFLSVLVASGIFWLLFMASGGRWIGYGDVRLGLITGTVLANPALSLLMIMTASVLGTLFVLPAIILGRKSLTAKLPFGPFLIAATWLVLLFGAGFISWYGRLTFG